MSRGKVIISKTETSWECDDCGIIYDDHLDVFVDGISVYSGTSDGHFGGGDNLRDPEVVLLNVLTAMGYDAHYGS